MDSFRASRLILPDEIKIQTDTEAEQNHAQVYIYDIRTLVRAVVR